MTSKLAATVLGIVFLAVGILGFIPNPIVSENGIFAVDTMHNIVHLVSGAVLLGGVYSSLGSGMALKIIGVIYGAVAVLGLVMGPGMLLGLIHVNANDNYLHVVLAVVILAAGFMLPDNKSA
jgi:hypothetical protein